MLFHSGELVYPARMVLLPLTAGKRYQPATALEAA